MIKIGITGGIGSGKSTVSQLFEIFGIPVYYADFEAKKMLNTDEVVISQILTLFGKQAYLDGKYNNKFVANLVFADKKLLDQLNSIVHPRLKVNFEAWCQQQIGFPYIVKEAALISSKEGLSHVIYVFASEHTRIERVIKRDPHRTVEQIREIISNQLSEKQFKELVDFVIDNEKELLIPQTLKIHQSLIA